MIYIARNEQRWDNQLMLLWDTNNTQMHCVAERIHCHQMKFLRQVFLTNEPTIWTVQQTTRITAMLLEHIHISVHLPNVCDRVPMTSVLGHSTYRAMLTALSASGVQPSRRYSTTNILPNIRAIYPKECNKHIVWIVQKSERNQDMDRNIAVNTL